MLRTLAAQIEAIWPQEKSQINLYRLPRNARVLDVGAGGGEFSARMAETYPDAQVVRVELLEASVHHARRRRAALLPRIRFETGDAYALDQSDNSLDLVANRHMIQSVPHVGRILAEPIKRDDTSMSHRIHAESGALLGLAPAHCFRRETLSPMKKPADVTIRPLVSTRIQPRTIGWSFSSTRRFCCLPSAVLLLATG
jgi:SAM-dependent methyltransferase